ncbi:MAG: hypothetical protein NTY38_30120, partial [Acidobacteria bacterium]|nr:hypothetical protein [Acidobacteriota bacterium]
MVSTGGRKLTVAARSTGGGTVQFTQVDKWPVDLRGDACELLVETKPDASARVLESLGTKLRWTGSPDRQSRGDDVLLHMRLDRAPDPGIIREVQAMSGVTMVWVVPPVFFPLAGEPIFANAAEMTALAASRSHSLGRIALSYEAALLGLPEDVV